MNKLLPILLVVVLSACGGTEKRDKFGNEIEKTYKPSYKTQTDKQRIEGLERKNTYQEIRIRELEERKNRY